MSLSIVNWDFRVISSLLVLLEEFDEILNTPYDLCEMFNH